MTEDLGNIISKSWGLFINLQILDTMFANVRMLQFWRCYRKAKANERLLCSSSTLPTTLAYVTRRQPTSWSSASKKRAPEFAFSSSIFIEKYTVETRSPDSIGSGYVRSIARSLALHLSCWVPSSIGLNCDFHSLGHRLPIKKSCYVLHMIIIELELVNWGGKLMSLHRIQPQTYCTCRTINRRVPTPSSLHYQCLCTFKKSASFKCNLRTTFLKIKKKLRT